MGRQARDEVTPGSDEEKGLMRPEVARAERRAGETPEFTKRRIQRRLKSKAARAARKRPK